MTTDAEFRCTNCEVSGYFEKACSVCRGKAAYSPDEIARMETAEAEAERLRTALENAEAERDNYWGALDEIADGVADPEWTAREALGRNE